MLLTANDIEFTFSHATGILKIPVRDILLIHIDTTYTNSLYFIYTDRFLSIKNRIHQLKYSEIESYNGGEVPSIEDLINTIKIFAPHRYFADFSIPIVTELPNPTIVYRAKIVLFDGGNEVDDLFYICLKNAAGTYYWKEIQLSIPPGILLDEMGYPLLDETGENLLDES